MDEEASWWPADPKPEMVDKLDAFAASALNAIIRNDPSVAFDKASEAAYEYAVYMIRERRRYK